MLVLNQGVGHVGYLTPIMTTFEIFEDDILKRLKFGPKNRIIGSRAAAKK